MSDGTGVPAFLPPFTQVIWAVFYTWFRVERDGAGVEDDASQENDPVLFGEFGQRLPFVLP